MSTILQVHFELLGRIAGPGNMEEHDELIGTSSQRVRNKPRLAMKKVNPRTQLPSKLTLDAAEQAKTDAMHVP